MMNFKKLEWILEQFCQDNVVFTNKECFTNLKKCDEVISNNYKSSKLSDYINHKLSEFRKKGKIFTIPDTSGKHIWIKKKYYELEKQILKRWEKSIIFECCQFYKSDMSEFEFGTYNITDYKTAIYDNTLIELPTKSKLKTPTKKLLLDNALKADEIKKRYKNSSFNFTFLKELHNSLFFCDSHSKQMINYDGNMNKIGEFKKNPNYIDSGLIFCDPANVRNALEKWINKFNEIPNSFNESVKRNILLHYWFLAIHPFEDGNGRTSRWLFSYYFEKWNFFKQSAISLINSNIKQKNDKYKLSLRKIADNDLLSIESFFDSILGLTIINIDDVMDEIDYNRILTKKYILNN